MHIEIQPPAGYLFRDDPKENLGFEFSSVGIWTIVNGFYYLVVQQADKPGLPWGIPSGHVDPFESDPRAVAAREFTEETGHPLSAEQLIYLTFIYHRPHAKGHLLYRTHISMDNEYIASGITTVDGTVLFEPPNTVNTAEISKLALIPLALAFHDNLMNANPFHPEYLFYGYSSLRALRIISGEFEDEYLGP